jgi:hypothetical protein
MKISRWVTQTTCVCAIAMLTACGTGATSAPVYSTGSALARLLGLRATAVTATPRGRSWMARRATAVDLLYVSDSAKSEVDVYSYPVGATEGKITGLKSPAGECVDKSGDVWIADTAESKIVEYAHGGSTPISTLSESTQYPVDCSVDPTTGNLAVSNTETTSEGQGSVAIYAHATGSPQLYSDTQLYYPFFLGYDDEGNLFVDGEQVEGAFQFAELPAGSSTLQNIALSKSIELAGGVLWDGKYVTVGDEVAGVIYQTGGASGEILGTTQLTGAKNLVQYWIPKLGGGGKNPQGTKVIGPNLNGGSVMFWNYPAGGTATKTLKQLDAPFGTAVSKGT